MAWSREASALVPVCGGGPRRPDPASHWSAAAGVPKPWSPVDDRAWPVALYFAAVPMLDWHAQLVRPGLVLQHEVDGLIGWGAYAAVGVSSIVVQLTPAADGGAVTARLGLDVLGHATAWASGPCNTRLDVATATLTARGAAECRLTVAADAKTRRLNAGLEVSGQLDPHSVNLSSGGLFDPVLAEIVEWLIKSGALHVDAGFRERSQSVLMELETLAQFSNAQRRVGEKSLLIALNLDGDPLP